MIPKNGPKIANGDKAPDFELPTDDGGTLRLYAHAGKLVVVFFYPKDNTPGCTSEAKDFTRLAPAFPAAGVTVVGISPDRLKTLQNFRAKHNLDVLLAADEDHAVAERYGVWAQKSMFGRKYMGIERSTFLIDRHGMVAEAWHKVSVSGHAEAVLVVARIVAKN